MLDSLRSFNTFSHPDTRPLKDGYRGQYGLQVSGGSEGGATYFMSGTYEREDGALYMPPADQTLLLSQRGVSRLPDWQIRPNAYQRVNLRANFAAPLGARGSATLSTGFVSNQTRLVPVFSSQQVGYRDANDGWSTIGANRPAYAFASREEDIVRRFLGSLATNYQLREWLTLRGTVGADLSTNDYGSLVRRGEAVPGSVFSTGRRIANQLNVAHYSLDLGVTATRPLSPAVVSKTSLGVQYNRRSQRGARIEVRDLPLGGETIAGAGAPGQLPNMESTLTTAVAGGYIEQVLGVRDRFFITGAVRLDGGSAFGKDFSVAAYPKAGISWLAIGSDGEKGPVGLNELRLRAAYGSSGVQPGPTDALNRVQVLTGVNLGGPGTAPGAAFVAGNPGLKPERTTEVEAGFDLGLWASRVRLEVTGYQRTSKDALVVRPNAPDIGIGTRVENLGSVRNRGVEMVLSADVVRGRPLVAGMTATASLNQNRLLRLGEGVAVRNPAAEFSQLEVGYPVFGQWGSIVESMADANGNGILERSELVVSSVSHFLGNIFPTREATAAPYLKLFGERLHLSGLLQYRGGFYKANNLGTGLCFSEATSCREVNDVSTPLAQQAPRVTLVSFGKFGPSYEDASFLMLRELSLGLRVPASVARLLRAREGQIIIAGRNLAVLWKASDGLPVENVSVSSDIAATARLDPGPTTYLLARVYLSF